METATVCYPVLGDELLLIRKRRGVGAGNVVGPGGKVEGGESLRDCVRREVREELRVRPTGLERHGVLDFHFGDRDPDGDSWTVHVYRADGVEGTPEETPEAVPERHPVSDPPYGEMWVDDRVWLPHLLDGRRFAGTFVLAADGESLLEYDLRLDDRAAPALRGRSSDGGRDAADDDRDAGGDRGGEDGRDGGPGPADRERGDAG